MELAYVTYMVVLLTGLKHFNFSWVTSEGSLTRQKDVRVTQNMEEWTLYVFYTPYIYIPYMCIYYMDLS